MGKRAPPTNTTGQKPSGGNKSNGGTKAASKDVKTNPFDLFKTRSKHTVANARPRSTNLAKSRTQAIEKRIATIGVEMKQKHRTSTLVDKRFGEYDPQLSQEDKMLIRFQKTRQKQLVNNKKSAFNLGADDDDDSDEEVFLTHKGKRLDEINYGEVQKRGPSNYQAPTASSSNGADDLSESEDSFEEARKDSAKSSFGGMTLVNRPQSLLDEDGDPLIDTKPIGENPGFVKTKQEAMSELIAKSKAFKHQAQMERESRMQTTDALNEDFRELRDLLGLKKSDLKKLNLKSKIESGDEGSEVEEDEEDDFDYGDDMQDDEGSNQGSESNEEDVSGDDSEQMSDEENVSSKKKLKKSQKERDENAMELDDFDLMVKRLSAPGVRKATPADALLTEEHIAKAEQARLLQLEKNRIARMNSKLNDDSDASDDDANHNNVSNAQKSRKSGGADDLDDDFTSQWLPKRDEDDSEDDSDDYEAESDQFDEEDSESGSDEEHDDDDDGGDYERPSKRRKMKENDEANDMFRDIDMSSLKPVSSLPAEGELPYAMAMPEDYSSFSSMLANQTPERQATIISRLRACHHISLHPDNKTKLSNLLKFLMKRIVDIGNNVSKAFKDNEATNTKPQHISTQLVQQIEILVKPIFDLSMQMNEAAASATKEMIEQFDNILSKKLNSVHNGDHKSVAPSFPLIFFAQVMATVWSSSDRRHSVVSPLTIHLAHTLATVRLQNVADIQKSLLLTNVFYQFLSAAKRWSGEPFCLLFLILENFAQQNRSDGEAKSYNPLLFMNETAMKLKDKSTASSTEVEDRLPLSNLVKPSEDPQHHDAAILQTIHACLVVLQQYLKLYSSETHAIDIFVTAKTLLRGLKDDLLPKKTASLKVGLLSFISRTIQLLGSTRLPLQQFLKKADVLPVLTPDFAENYYGQQMTEDRVARETKKLKNKIKSEQKGAEKELRKDTKFIQQQKYLQRMEKTSERIAKSNQNLALLQGQQSEMNKDKKKRK